MKAHIHIAVNCITPAAARTRLFDQMTQVHIDYMLAKIPRGRFVEVDEIASMVAWLVSAENSFTTAAVFDLSGGRAFPIRQGLLVTSTVPVQWPLRKLSNPEIRIPQEQTDRSSAPSQLACSC